jgi:hypothetical protein
MPAPFEGEPTMFADLDFATSVLDLDALARAPLETDPFDYLVVPGFVPREAAAAARLCFPLSAHGGIVPARAAEPGDGFDRLLAAIRAPEFTAAMSRKFGVFLDPRALMLTMRSRCRPQDGGIHADSVDKVVTALIYLNESWGHAGGMLRILRSATDIDDMAAEVPPLDGTLLAFHRTDRSFHGHLPYDGVRRAIMLNWMADVGAARRETLRHSVSAVAKRLKSVVGV